MTNFDPGGILSYVALEVEIGRLVGEVGIMGKLDRDSSYSDEQIEDLWNRLWSGDDSARQELHLVYLPLVKYIAGTYARSVPAYADSDGLLSHGFFGLDDAITKYVPSAKFETYASTRIRGSIIDFLRDSDWLPRGIRKVWRTYQDTCDEFLVEHHREPTLEEVLELTNLDPDVLWDALIANDQSYMTHYNAPHPEAEHELVLSDVLSDNQSLGTFTQIEIASLSSKLQVALSSTLDEREECVVYWRYVEGLPLVDIAARLGVQQSIASLIHSSAVDKLRLFISEDM